MARKNQAQRSDEWLEESRDGFTAAYDATIGERRQSLQDRRFAYIAGAQFEDGLAEQFANKPKFELSFIGRALQKLIGDYRQQRITVDFVPRDGGKADAMAEALDGMYRADEGDSDGQEAYDVAFSEGSAGGMGAWRYTVEKDNPEDDEDEKQRITVQAIHDADRNVFFDVGCRKYDKSDAEWAWVLTPIPRNVYKRRYGDDPATWPESVSSNVFDWFTPDDVVIVEAYRVREETDTVEVWESPTGEQVQHETEDLDEEPGPDEAIQITQRERITALGWVFVKAKKRRCKYVEKAIHSGGRMLEAPTRIAGKHIPIVPYYANRVVVEGIERWWGEVRMAKDAQRLANMQVSLLAEIAADGQKRVPIFLNQQVASSAARDSWQNGQIRRDAYRILDEVRNPATGNLDAAGPVGYDEPPVVPPAQAALLQISDGMLTRLLGGNGEAKEVKSNVSAEAVQLIQTANEVSNTVPLDNLRKSMRRAGEIWLSMAREVYVEKGRKLKIVEADGTASNVELGRIVMASNGIAGPEIDLSHADYQVITSTGPLSTTAKSATVKALTGMAQMASDPETSKVLSAAALSMMDGEGLDGVKSYFRNFLLQVGAAKPTDEEAQKMEQARTNQSPDAQTAYLMAEAQKSMATTVKANAETERTNAQTLEILAGLDQAQKAQAMEAFRLLVETTRGNQQIQPAAQQQ
jgi:hypothetical protein